MVESLTGPISHNGFLRQYATYNSPNKNKIRHFPQVPYTRTLPDNERNKGCQAECRRRAIHRRWVESLQHQEQEEHAGVAIRLSRLAAKKTLYIKDFRLKKSGTIRHSLSLSPFTLMCTREVSGKANLSPAGCVSRAGTVKLAMSDGVEKA